MGDIRWRIRLANRTLAVFFVVLFAGAFLLRNADEAVIQVFGMTAFLAMVVVQLLLEVRYERRHGSRDEGGDQ